MKSERRRRSLLPTSPYRREQAAISRRRLYPVTVFYTLFSLIVLALAWRAGHLLLGLAFYLAGADPLEGDRLGRLALTKAGLRRRDEVVLERLAAAGVPVCVVLAGGYAEDVRDTVDINVGTAEAVAARMAGVESHP